MELDNNPTHEEIWDDSALINSWNQALEEYKKYHSIHAQGGTIEDLLDAEKVPAAGGTAKPETEQPLESGGSHPRHQKSDETQTENRNETSQEAKRTQIGGQKQVTRGGTAPVMAPQMLLGSVQDEDLKKLLMSWYYAGYYTGLYEGKQQAEQASKPPQ